MKTLLCTWYGEPVYEEDATRELLLELIKHLKEEIKSTDHQNFGSVTSGALKTIKEV